VTEPAFAVDSVTQEFGDRRVLAGIRLAARHGEVVGVLGENGAGTSTLFGCIAAIPGHNPGVCRIEERYGPPERRWMSVGYLPQESFLPRSLRVERAIRQVATRVVELVDGRLVAKDP
jgi:ABC-type multidrug transport system ATPase subunit